MKAADVCRENGWVVGDRLVGTEEKGCLAEDTSIIEITAIGRSNVLAVRVASQRYRVTGAELVWSLDHRDWRKV
ncbi:MAG: hypothetical protein EBR82_22590 [Caulobacteraceae bacterium]|nr:hypothetical protein [Caulobacteraceae bacterium]